MYALLVLTLTVWSSHGKPSSLSQDHTSDPNRLTCLELDERVTITANTSSKVRNGDLIKVSWVNPRASPLDWIGFYTPPSSGVDGYIDYVYVSDTEDWRTGAGYFYNTIFNMRADVEIRYISIGLQNEAAVSARFLISFPENEPMHGHIAVTGKPGEMRVMWGSAKPDNPRVKYSMYSDLSEAEVAKATSTTYKAEDICGPEANIPSPHLFIDPGYFHTATLQDLKAGARYYYVYGSGDSWSELASFVAAPGPNTKVRETRFIGYGDMGVMFPQRDPDGPGSRTVMNNLNHDISAGAADFILHFGDISYARGKGYMWDQFMTQLTYVSERVPYMVGVGNHEYDYLTGGEKDPSGAPGNGFHPAWGNYGDDSNGECGVPTYHRYKSPDNGNNVFWYSFDYGLVHVVMFSSEHDFRPGSPMYKWLEVDLASVDREITPWVVVSCHRPLYTSQEQASQIIVGEHMKEALEDLFYTYKVNLHLSGHEHSYERTCTVVKNKCVSPGRGTLYIVVGTAGFELERELFYPNPWSEFHCCDRYGYQYIEANSTHMHIQFITGPEASVTDSVTIPLWDNKN